LRKDCEQYRNDLFKKCNENDKLKEDFKQSEESLVILRYENIKLKDELDKGAECNDELKNQLEKYKEMLATLRAENEEFKDRLDKKTGDHLATYNENGKLKAQVKQTEEILSTSRTENRKLNNKLIEESKKCSKLSLEIKRYHEEVLRLEQDLTQYKASNESMSNELLRKDFEIQELQHKNEECVKNFNDLLQEKEEEKQELMGKNTRLKTEASEYQSALGTVTNTRINNYPVQLKNDILDLQDMLKNYITSLKGNFESISMRLKIL
jgi:chromosome segregation ATPase